jgi:hypothetical protein
MIVGGSMNVDSVTAVRLVKDAGDRPLRRAERLQAQAAASASTTTPKTCEAPPATRVVGGQPSWRKTTHAKRTVQLAIIVFAAADTVLVMIMAGVLRTP